MAMAICSGVPSGGLELALLKVSDFEDPIWIYSRVASGEARSARSQFLTFSSPDVTDMVRGLLRVVKKESQSELFESSDGDFRLEARQKGEMVEVSVSIGEPMQARSSYIFACSYDELAAFAGSVRVEQSALLEKAREK